MPEQQRLLELALKALETERAQLDADLAEIRGQLGYSTSTVRVFSSARKKRRPMSAAARKKISDAMKRRHAALKTPSTTSPQASERASGALTAAGRKKLSQMMKARWAAKKKAAKKAP